MNNSRDQSYERLKIFSLNRDHANFILFRRFTINATSGEIFVATNKGCNCTGSECDDSDLNWEKNPVYYLTAEAQDGGGRRSSVPVEIHLMDINDNAPQFRYSNYETSIKENSTTFSSGKLEFIVQVFKVYYKYLKLTLYLSLLSCNLKLFLDYILLINFHII